jgi:hypothetical protein
MGKQKDGKEPGFKAGGGLVKDGISQGGNIIATKGTTV